LNISGNYLKELPLSISGLVSLKTLDVKDNPKLKRIPKEIAQLCGLETLLLDEKHINYPDPEIVSKGTEAIMRFLCSGRMSFPVYCLITMMDMSHHISWF
jgi:internalin A